LDEAALAQQVAAASVVVDCTDNFQTRFAINAACVAHKKPLVSGAAIRLEGQISVFDLRADTSPCYACLYEQSDDELSCAANGVLAPLVGVIGSMQALETIKLICDFGTSLKGRVQLYDGRHGQWRELKLAKDARCSVCGPK